MSYEYWDSFVDSWKNYTVGELASIDSFNGWENPNLTPLLNCSRANDFSLHYLPEPWWGNNGHHPLNAVVINYNPGQACRIQHHSQSAFLFGFDSYSAFVNSEVAGSRSHFPHTTKWHKVNRSNMVFDTLEEIGVDLKSNRCLKNFLSIELVPWHTTNISNIGSYIKKNITEVFKHSLLFAADRSTTIENNFLKNKVLLKISGNKIKWILGDEYREIKEGRICNGNLVKDNEKATGCFLKFCFPDIQNVEFICIWGPRSRNNFPNKKDMNYIFSTIIH